MSATVAAAPEPAGAPDAPSPAVAPPPGNPRFALFDSLRGIALLAVVAFHVASITGALSDRPLGTMTMVLGPQAPLLFFVLSGFLLYRPWVAARARGRAAPSTARYARRRVLRIVPAYWVALTVLAIFPGIAGVFTGDWWRYYFFLQLYSARTLGGGIPVAWTLCVEVTFYLALPAWALAVRRLRARSARALLATELIPLAVIAAAGAVVQVLAAQQHLSTLVADSIAGQCTWLALGMALAVLSVAADGAERDGRRLPAVRWIARHSGLLWLGALAAIAGLVALLWDERGLADVIAALQTAQPLPETVARIALSGILLTLLVLPAAFGDDGGGVPRRIMALRPLLWLGVVSYGAYIWHLTAAELLALRADPGHFSARGLGLLDHLHHLATPVLFVLTLVVALVLAALSYRFVELPFLRRKERARGRS